MADIESQGTLPGIVWEWGEYDECDIVASPYFCSNASRTPNAINTMPVTPCKMSRTR